MKRINPLVSDDSVLSILQIASAYQKSKILLTACELDLFSTIGNEAKTAKQVANDLKTDERATEKLLNALCSIRLLSKDSEYYRNTKGTRRFLVKGNPDFIGSLMHLSHLWNPWGNLTETLKNGEPPNFKDISEKDPQWIESYLDSLHWRAMLQAPDIIRTINLEDVENVLDLGGGSGIYSIEFVKAKPWLNVTIFDLPNIIEHTDKIISQTSYKDKIHTRAGDVLTDNFGSGYDIIFISHLLSEFSIWDNFQIMRKIFEALNHEGQVIIQDYIIDDNKTSPQHAAIYTINMLVNTLGGESYTETDIWIMLKEAWFSDIESEKTPFGTTIIKAKKNIHY